jgi:hypothetical protein
MDDDKQKDEASGVGRFHKSDDVSGGTQEGDSTGGRTGSYTPATGSGSGDTADAGGELDYDRDRG